MSHNFKKLIFNIIAFILAIFYLGAFFESVANYGYLMNDWNDWLNSLMPPLTDWWSFAVNVFVIIFAIIQSIIFIAIFLTPIIGILHLETTFGLEHWEKDYYKKLIWFRKKDRWHEE